jgi:hypothetical protein
MNQSRALAAGLVLSGLVSLIDVLAVAGLGLEAAPPGPVVIIGAVLGVITVLAVPPAWRGSTRAALVVIASRLVSAVLAIPALVIDSVPGWARAFAAVVALLSLLGAGLVSAGLRQRASSVPPVAQSGAHR